MERILITISAELDPDLVQEALYNGATKENILKELKHSIRLDHSYTGIIYDYEVTEVREN